MEFLFNHSCSPESQAKIPSMSNHLPQEILVEILHRLPPKTLVKCTSVCKSWRSLITSASFISLHRNHSPSSLLLQLCDEHAFPNFVHYSLRRDDPFLTESSSLRLPPSFNLEFSVVGICHGLVCVTSTETCHDLIICNPSLRLQISLPKPCDYPSLHSGSVAFGFDSRNNDYKVVRIACMLDDDRYGLSSPEVEVYSMASGFWSRNRVVSAPVGTLCCVGSYYSPHGFVDGKFHWGARRQRRVGGDDGWYYFVLSYNFEDDVFGEVMLPETVACASSDMPNVTVIGGGDGKVLTVYHVDGVMQCSCDIWVMKEYGVVGSWNNVFTFTLTGFNLEVTSLGVIVTGMIAPPTPLCVRNGGEVLLLMDEEGIGCLYSVDLETKAITNCQIGGEEFTWYLYAGYYAESLVLLDKASGLVSY